MSANQWGHGVPSIQDRERLWKMAEQRLLQRIALRRSVVWLACVAVLTAGVASAQDAAVRAVGPQETVAPASFVTRALPASSPLRTASRSSDYREPIPASEWHPTLVRDRQLETRLNFVRRELEAGRVAQGLAVLQYVLDQPQDHFVQLRSDQVPSGAHRLAADLLSVAQADQLETYQLLFAAEANQLLQKAMKEQDPQSLREVVRRFFYTPAGFTALDRLSSRALDLGDYTLASAGYQRLLSEPVHRPRVTSQLRLKAALCYERIGNSRRAKQLLTELGSLPVTVGGQHLAPQLWYSRIGSSGSVTADVRVVGGNFDRNGVSAGTAPALGYPVWGASLSDSNSRHLDAIVNTWVEEQSQEGSPLGMAHFPLSIGSLLLFRDFEGVRAVEGDTGRTAWSYDCESSLARDIPPQNSSTSPENPGRRAGQRALKPDYHRRRNGADGRMEGDSGNLGRQLVGNWTMGMLSSDGRLVFAIDQLESNWNQRGIIPGQIEDPQAANRQTNLLVALSLQPSDPSNVKPRWTLGGPANESQEGNRVANHRRLAGHFFMGPPLPLDGKLYAITETRQQLNIVCVRADDGELLWQQELCALSIPVWMDQARYYLACSPAYSDGVIVCPTHSGMLAAVDPLTGELLWSSSYDGSEQQQRLAAAPFATRKLHGHVGYPNFPLVHNGRVLYLPAHSEAICCFDLRTGKLQWRTRREDFEQAIEYVAAADDGWVLVVGRRRCRGLSLENGSELWSIPLTSMPAGRGCRVGSNYLVPLSEGVVLSLDPRTGRRTGFSLPRGEIRPGNLLVSGDMVISMGSRELQAFPQAGPWLKKIAATGAGQTVYAGQELLAAELEMTVGRTANAQQHLQRVLTSSQSSPGITPRAELLLRELLFSELTQSNTDPRATFERLHTLVKGTDQLGRLLAFQSDFHRQRGDTSALIATARELTSLAYHKTVMLDQDPSRQLASATLARHILETVRTSPRASASLDLQIAAEFAAAVKADDIPRMQRLLEVYSQWPAIELAQLELARVLSRNGNDQKAELLLLKSIESRQPSIAAAAICRLIDLYNERGLYQESGHLLRQLTSRYSDTRMVAGLLEQQRLGSQTVAMTKPVSSYLTQFPRQHPAWEAYLQLTETVSPRGQVRITESRWPNKALQDLYGMQFLNTPRDLGFDLFDMGGGGDGRMTSFQRQGGHELPLMFESKPQALWLDRDTTSKRRLGTELKFPDRYYYPVQPQQSFVGHFFPIGGTGAAHGVSLLENRIVWTVIPPGLSNCTELVRVGPAGAGFSIFQCRQHLFSVDPVTGHLQWQRSDLETRSGLSEDALYGLFGDERVLVLFASDRMHYTLYDTATGEELRRGRLDINVQQSRRTIGRKLFYYSGAASSRQIRIWDPLTDEVVWHEDADSIQDFSMHAGVPAGTKVLAHVANTDELAYLTVDGRLKIIDVNRGRKVLEIPWPGTDRTAGGTPRDPGFLKVFCDADRYYVNLQQIQPPADLPLQNSFIVSDATIPAFHVTGDVAAIDRKSQRVLWVQNLDNCSILQFPELRLPVLITAARIKHGTQLAMRLEVLDARTGRTTRTDGEFEPPAVHDRLLAERLLHYSYERQPRVLELRTPKSTIRVDLAAPR